MERLGIEVGDTVLVELSGSVIPKIVKVVEKGEGNTKQPKGDAE